MKFKKRLIWILASVLLIIILTSSALICSQYYKKKLVLFMNQDDINPANNYVTEVTVIQLIATPERYDGKLIRVIGVGNLEFEGNAIYLSKEDQQCKTDNCIWIDLGEKATPYNQAREFNGEYVIVEGLFDKDDHGHMGLFYGAINEVSRYELRKTNNYINIEDCFNITNNGDSTFTYKITDINGNILLLDNNVSKFTKANQPKDNVISLSLQTGSGYSTNEATYYDYVQGLVSDKFYYVLGARGDYVYFVNKENNQYKVVVQNMFDASVFSKSYTLSDVSPLEEPIVDFKIKSEEIVVIKYLKGDNNIETESTIDITND